MKYINPICNSTQITEDPHVWLIDTFDYFQKETEHIVSSIHKEYSDPLILYRGQRDVRWMLDSKLVRSCKEFLFGSPVADVKNSIINESVEYNQLLFSLLLFKMRVHYPSKELEKAAQDKGVDPLFELHRRIQQYPEEDKLSQLKGTILMDWTTCNDVALYFMNESRDGDGAIYICDAPATGKTWQNNYVSIVDKMIDVNNEGKVFGCPVFIHPPKQIPNERIKRQKAIYCAQMDMRYPLDEIWTMQEADLENKLIYTKLVLNNGTQKSVNDYLEKKEKTYNYLFPK